MISYPLFADQPGMARRCQEFGFAIPLVSEPRSSFEPPDVVRAIRDIESHHETMLGELAKGRQWEESVINARPAVIAKILACA
jgi:hypothetical protein